MLLLKNELIIVKRDECLVPHHKESTGPRLFTEVKPCGAKLVLGWVTA